MNELSITFAFVAGLISFLAPCVLPIIPGFLAYLAGTSVSEAGGKRKDIFINSVFFVLGFALVFAALGVLLNTLLERVAFDVLVWLSRIGGIIIIFFGLYLTGLIKIRFLEQEHKIRVKKKFKSKYLTSFVFGAAFAVGWSPCVGAVLGAILGLAASQPGVAFWLLLSYAIGFGVPFLIVGLFASQATKFINRFIRWVKYINIVFGIILVILGILIFTQNLSRIANFEFITNLFIR
jgi:cytochrome c-type biogenesis protein